MTGNSTARSGASNKLSLLFIMVKFVGDGHTDSGRSACTTGSKWRRMKAIY